MPARCLVISNDIAMRTGVAALSTQDADLRVDTAHPDAALNRLATARFDLVLIDTTLLARVELTRRLVEHRNVTRLGLLGPSFSRTVQRNALRHGIRVFVATTVTADDLVASLRRGTTSPLPPGLSGVVRQPAVPDGSPADVADDWPGRSDGLSRREADVLTHAANGLTNQEIADRLFLSVETVRTHLKGAYRTLGLHNRSQATKYVLNLTKPTDTATDERAIIRGVDVHDLTDLATHAEAFLSVGSAAWEVRPHNDRVAVLTNGRIALAVIDRSDRAAQRRFAAFFPPDDAARFLDMFTQLNDNEHRTFTHRITLPNGNERDVLTHLVAGQTPTGQRTINGVTIDITMARAAVRSSHALR